MLAEISNRISTLSPAERRVGRWILDHPRQAARATLAELAAGCGASEPTVIRFCRRLGLAGFRELGLRLSEASAQPTSYLHRDVQPDDRAADAAAKVIDASVRGLLDVLTRLSSIPLDNAVAAMRKARQLAFAGLGASGYVAGDACHKFFRLGLPCTALTDTPSILQFAAIADPDDVLIIASHSGRWTDLARAAGWAKVRGSTVIALTDPRSNLASAASIVFPCDAHEDTNVYTPMSSRLAQLALLDALQVALALAMGDAAVARLKLTKSALRPEPQQPGPGADQR